MRPGAYRFLLDIHRPARSFAMKFILAHDSWLLASCFACLAALALLLFKSAGLPPAADFNCDREAKALAEEIKVLYLGGRNNIRRGGRVFVEDSSGRWVERERIYRDHPAFIEACACLLQGEQKDSLMLGAWLLGSVGEQQRERAESLLLPLLDQPDPLVVFYAVNALASTGSRRSLDRLARLYRHHELEIQTAAAWAADAISRREGEKAATPADLAGIGAAPRPSFLRGLCWYPYWESDRGRTSFELLASLGVNWISVHTWDAIQERHDRPEFGRRPLGFRIPGLLEIVANARRCAMRVMIKPHLELSMMARLSEKDKRILAGADEKQRRAILRKYWTQPGEKWHGDIEMKSEADWRAWFDNYAAYITDYARQAQEVGADMFCVGRELDATAIKREADWRRLIAEVRKIFKGELTYSANFTDYDKIKFWDALDYIGISAYFPAPKGTDFDRLVSSWEAHLDRIEALHMKLKRPVLFAEIGFPSTENAAATPWREGGTIDLWLQARCYRAALAAIAKRPWLAGTFFWQWERSWGPPFRDGRYTPGEKPACFALSRWYRALAGK